MDTDPDTFLLAYARVLRRHRKNMELSQEELAFRAGLSMRYISLLESGKHQQSWHDEGTGGCSGHEPYRDDR